MKASILVTTIALAATALSAPALAEDEYNTSAGYTAAGAPLGVHGVDPVAFIELGNRIDGRADFAAVHDGVAYYFATEANRDTFSANPERYLPQNGGFCTYGVSVGKKFDGDPRYAAVVDGQLYLFLSEAIFQAYLRDQQGVIDRAAANWPEIRSTPAGEL